MRELYLDCFAGISGNMILGALLDLGLSADDLSQELNKLPLGQSKLIIDKVTKKSISATYFDVDLHHEHHHRHLKDVIEIINEGDFDPVVKKDAVDCFALLAEAEAKVHGVDIQAIHFHEVGAVDAIVDIVGTCWGLHALGVASIKVSPVRVGFGTVQCEHGLIPLPAPAAMELLKGFPVYGGEFEGEWTTPTGAAILKKFAVPVNGLPEFKLLNIGYGAGSSERIIPNVLRIILGENEETGSDEESQVVVETNIDDMNPEIFGYLGDKLLENGVRDYFMTPVYMKKGRPGTLLTAVVSPENVPKIEEIILSETTTLGIRKYPVKRRCLSREMIKVEMDGYQVGVKLGYINDSQCKIAPEFEDCRGLALKTGRPMLEIYHEAMISAKKIMAEKGTPALKSE